MKYFIHLAYKGTRYHGWQRQPNHPSVQETLEDAIRKMTGQQINCIGCGRTDAGVHASQFFCHIKVEEPFDYDPVFRLNKLLPNDISIYDFIEVKRDAHAQHDASLRTYTYRIHFDKNPFLSDVSSFYSKKNLDFEKMEQATALFRTCKDFRAVCKQPDLYNNTLCEMQEARMEINATKTRLIFTFSANRFLRGMVRIIIGNILEVGYGRLRLQDLVECLNSGISPTHFNSVYPQGLYLSGVEYPYLKSITTTFPRF